MDQDSRLNADFQGSQGIWNAQCCLGFQTSQASQGSSGSDDSKVPRVSFFIGSYFPRGFSPGLQFMGMYGYPGSIQFSKHGTFDPHIFCKFGNLDIDKFWKWSGPCALSIDSTSSGLSTKELKRTRGALPRAPTTKRAKEPFKRQSGCGGLFPKIGWTIDQYCERCHG